MHISLFMTSLQPVSDYESDLWCICSLSQEVEINNWIPTLMHQESPSVMRGGHPEPQGLKLKVCTKAS